jgi:hypothetical protein
VRIAVHILGTEVLNIRLGEKPEPKPPDPPTDITSHQGGSFSQAPPQWGQAAARGFIRWVL